MKKSELQEFISLLQEERQACEARATAIRFLVELEPDSDIEMQERMIAIRQIALDIAEACSGSSDDVDLNLARTLDELAAKHVAAPPATSGRDEHTMVVDDFDCQVIELAEILRERLNGGTDRLEKRLRQMAFELDGQGLNDSQIRERRARELHRVLGEVLAKPAPEVQS
jgi:hypothetical protein